MADVASTFAAWSSITGNNFPQGTASVGNGLDDNLRELAGVVVRGLSHKGADIASASTTDLGAVEGKFHDITGSATISSFGTVRSGIEKWLQFDGSPTIVDGVNLVTLTGENRTVTPGTVACYISEGSGVWRELVYSEASASQFTTGDVKLTLRTTADPGWVLMNDGTIGSAASGGTSRANADTANLFTLLWNNTTNSECAVSGGRGASAAADFAANKTIALPKAVGRALAGYGAGAGLSNRLLASITGAETHTLSSSEMPSHTHGSGSLSGTIPTTFTGGTPGTNNVAQEVSEASDGTVPVSITGGSTGSAGGDGAHANMQPTLFLNVMIKL